MSLFKKLGRGIKRLAKNVAPLLPGPAGVIAGALAGRGGAKAQASRPTFNLPPTMGALPNVASSFALPAIPAVSNAIGVAMSIPRIARSIPGVAGAAGRVIRGTVSRMPAGGTGRIAKWSKRAAAAAGYLTVGSLIYDQAGNIIGQAKRRRMNPLNHRALTRAVRRVKGATKICREVEKLTGSRRSRAPRAAAYCPPTRRGRAAVRH